MINWGIIGAGSIARVFSNAMRFSKTGRLMAVASRGGEAAARLAAAFDIPRAYSSYEALLEDDGVDAVYIANIHPVHAQWVIKSAAAGKHILVEKPIGLNAAEASAMVAAARTHDRFLMEAFMYRCHPQIARMVELIQAGAIGQLRLIRVAFGYHAPYDESSRAYNNTLGGGSILDVGCYPASMARLLAGAAAGQPFSEPELVLGSGRLGPTGVDHLAAATLRFEEGLIAELITGIDCYVPGQVVVYGSAGMLTIPNPWLPSSPCRSARDPLPLDTVFPPATLLLQPAGRPLQEIEVAADRDLFTYEIDMVGQHLEARQAPAMTWQDTLGNMQLLDRWRAAVGVVYEQEKRIRS